MQSVAGTASWGARRPVRQQLVRTSAGSRNALQPRRQQGADGRPQPRPDAAARHRSRETLVHAEASSSPDGGESIPAVEIDGSEAWRRRPVSVALSRFAPRAEHTFLAAALLKLVLLASIFPKTIVFRPLGYTPHGLVGWLLLLPVAAGLALAARAIDSSGLMKRRGSGLLLVGLCWLALTGAGQLYAWRPPQQPQEAAAAPPEGGWRAGLFDSRAPRTAEDADRVWGSLEAESQTDAQERGAGKQRLPRW